MKPLFSATLAVCVALALPVHAQDFPTRPVTLIVSFSPGGLTDIPARILAPEMQQRLRQSVIVENKAGASGITGGSYVVRSEPDGYTMLVSALSEVQNFYYLKVPYDALTDLAPVGKVVDGPPLVLIVKEASAYKSVSDLVTYAKANPTKVNFSTSGAATTPAIAVDQLNSLAGTTFVQVPYKGTGPAAAAVASGDVDASFVFYPSAKGLIDGGQLRVLAVTSAKRLSILPDTPSMIELGFAGFQHTAFVGLSAPKGTPKNVIAKLNKALNESIESAAFRSRVEPLGMTIPEKPNTPEAYGQYMAKEAAHQAELAKLSGHAAK
ncbi:MAG TPA: tripartite tricarboxylate transporter substrate binding protein [Pseudolabrys sp.]|jgi:tripartite-type tricarboxylate transporter receptor subunit TctC